MKTTILISLFVVFGGCASCQLRDVKIIDSANYKINLRFLDDQFALFVYDWSDQKEHQLLSYKSSGDTIILVDSDDEIMLSTDVFYDYNEAVEDGLIMFQTQFLNVYEKGHMSGGGFKYESPCGDGIPADSNDLYHTVVLPCELSKFPLVVQLNTLEDINIAIDMPDGMNHVKIIWNAIFSTHYSVIIKESDFPMNRVINNENKVIIFKWK